MFGVGVGTAAVLAFAVIGIFICFIKDCTATPSIMVCIGICLPLIVFAIIWGCPKENLSTDTS